MRKYTVELGIVMGFFKGTSIWKTKIAGNTYILCEQKLLL